MASPDGSPVSAGFVGSLGRACFSDLWLHACPGRDLSYRTGTRRALLAAVQAGELDIAIFPGTAGTAEDSLLLCEDHLAAALGAHHPLTRFQALDLGLMRDSPMLLPIEGEQSDFRRLVQVLVPGLAPFIEMPMPRVIQRLTTSDALAILAGSQCEELRGPIVTRPIAGLNTAFPIHLTWSARLAAFGLGELLATRISPPAAACAKERAGRWTDDAGDGSGNRFVG